MKLKYTLMAAVFLIAAGSNAQHYLFPSEGIKVAYVNPDDGNIQSCEADLFYTYWNDGDSIYQLSLLKQQVLKAWGRPADYSGPVYPTFLTISPDSKALWIGYTNADNSDSRIYEFDLAGEQWKLAARMPGNFELDFHGDSILVSGLNSADFMAPNGVFVLDTSGADQHRRILDIGGSSSGMGVQANGDLYVATSRLGEANALYRWSAAQVDALIANVDAAPLLPSEGEKLSDLPQGGYDCEVDAGGNVVFTMNLWGGQQVLARWDGGMGDGMHFDTLAVSEQWLGLIRSRGNYAAPQMGNSLLVTSYGMPLADVHTADYPPVVANPIPDQELLPDPGQLIIDVSQVFSDPDDDDADLLLSLSEEHADGPFELVLEGGELVLTNQCHLVKSAFNTFEVILEASLGGLSTRDTFVVSVECTNNLEDEPLLAFQVYPNPSSGSLRVDVSGSGEIILEVYSLSGNLLLEQARHQPGSVLDLGNLNSGSYILRIRDARRTGAQLIHIQ